MEVPEKLRSALVGIRYWLFAFVFLTTATLLVSCNNSSTITIVKGPDSLTITVSSNTTHPGDEVSVTATVVDDQGNPLNEMTVEFALTNNNSNGSLSAKSEITDLNGQATIIYTAGIKTSVTDRITAKVTLKGADDVELTKTATADIKVDPTLIGSISVSSGASVLVANGSSQTAIRATLRDVNNAPVAGTTVAFTTTLGSIGASATTNIDGIAEVTLTAGTVPGTATVTAVGGGFNGQVQIVFVADAPDTLTVTALPDSVDPNGQTTITATVKDGNGNPIQGETVNFSVETNESGGSLGTISALTDVNGQASVVYTAGSTTGTDTIKARSASNEDVNGEVDVDVTAGSIVVGSVTVVAGTGQLIADGSSSTVIRATVLSTGGQLASGIVVNFSTTAGNLSPLSATTDGNGIAEVTLTSATNLGTATITANARGFIDTTEVTFIAGGVDNVVLTANPTNILADGSSTSVVTAQVTDDDGNPVANGEVISFSITAGGGTLSSINAATVNGLASVTYTSPTSGTFATIRGEATNGAFGTVSIVFTTEQTGSIDLTLGTASLLANGTQSTLATAVVTNTDGNPVSDGTTVTFTIPVNGGDIDSTTGGTQLTVDVPTTGGIAVAVLKASLYAGQYIITATSGGVGDLEFYELTPGPAAALYTSISANPTSIPADGISTSLITVVAGDATGVNPVADGTTVNFYTDLGSLSSPTAPTAFGMATVVLTSGTTDGQATVTAVVDGVTVQTTVDFGFVAGVGTGTASTIQLSVSSQTIRVKGSGGRESTVITATARDESGNPITNCTNNMTFTIVNGPGGGEELDGIGTEVDKSTTNGTATVSLTSGTISGTVTIKVAVWLNGICGAGDGEPPAGDGTAPYDTLPPYAVALTTPIGIEAGEPANIVIFQPSEIDENSDGSLSMILSALVQDQYSNPVENGTVIFFGCVDNPTTALHPERDGYKIAGMGDTVAGSAVFGSVVFVSPTSMDYNSVSLNDTFIILEGQDEGGHILKDKFGTSAGLAANDFEFYNSLVGDDDDLPFVAGTAELGTICGSVSTGNLEPDGTCTPSTGTSIKGVAHSRLTWTPQGIFKPYYCYAESVGRTVGDAIGDTYPAVAPVTITVTINPPTVLSGEQDIEVFALYKDGGAGAGHPIPNEEITFSSGNPLVAYFAGSASGPGDATITDTTGSDGRATTDNLDTLECLSEQTSVTITASSGPFAGSASVTIQPTAPTADFTCTDTKDGTNADCADDSTTPTGTTIDTWSWDVDCDGAGPGDTTTQNPTLALGPGTTQVCLTVTNDAGCSDSISKSISIAGPPTVSFTSVENTDGTADFTDTSTAYPGTTNTAWNWIFPLGTIPATSAVKNPTGIDFTSSTNNGAAGNFNVELQVTNSAGITASATQTVTFAAPVAILSSNSPGPGDCTLDFTDASTTTESTITAWTWTFPASTNSPSGVNVANPAAVDFTLVAGIVSGANNVSIDLQVTDNVGNVVSTGATNVSVTCP